MEDIDPHDGPVLLSPGNQSDAKEAVNYQRCENHQINSGSAGLYLLELVFLFSLNKYLEVELLDHMVVKIYSSQLSNIPLQAMQEKMALISR